MPVKIKSFKDNLPFYAFCQNQLFAFGDDPFAGLGEAGTRGKYSIRNEVTWGQETHDIKVTFKGDFTGEGGVWSGELNAIQFYLDGQKVGTMKGFGSETGFAEVSEYTSSSLLWRFLLEDGVKIDMKKADYSNLLLWDGDDVIKGTNGYDSITGYAGDDRLIGRKGDDTLDGNNGDDYIDGGKGSDSITGGHGSDTVIGGKGDDIFYGGGGLNNWDDYTGGAGADTYVIIDGPRYEEEVEGVIFRDFSLADGDMIDFNQLIFSVDSYEEYHYLADAAFSGGDNGDMEIRMEGGLLEVDTNGDGSANVMVMLAGHDTIEAPVEDWLTGTFGDIMTL